MRAEGEILTNLKAVQLGGRKLVQRSKWKQESKKIAQNSGNSYISTSKKLVEDVYKRQVVPFYTKFLMLI